MGVARWCSAWERLAGEPSGSGSTSWEGKVGLGVGALASHHITRSVLVDALKLRVDAVREARDEQRHRKDRALEPVEERVVVEGDREVSDML